MGPDLTAITQIKSDSVIAAYMKNPGQYNQQSRMPSYSHLSRAKRKAIISFLKN
jgi:cbb3-type cytochrome oxidase cytochrome c subunit